MKRKTFINRMALATGGTLFLPSASLLQSCAYEPRSRNTLTEDDIPFFDEIGETFIPETDSSPGAKATKIGAYMFLMFNDCMLAEEQDIFISGINELDERAVQTFSNSFIEAKSEEKLSLLQSIQKEAEAYYLKMEGAAEIPPHYFQLFKDLTLSGYFTSEIGMTQAREYLPLPGNFEACIPYTEGAKPWAT